MQICLFLKMSSQNVLKLRYELGDSDELPILSDAEYSYYLSKHENNIRRSMIDAAKAILFKLSMRGDETVDIFSLKGSKAAEQYRQALQLFIKNPEFNPALTMAEAYAGGISKSDMQENIDEEDNNAVLSPLEQKDLPDSYFEV